MITITLNKIRAHSPCESGWKTLLKSKGGTTADYSVEFPLTDVLDISGLHDTLWCLRCLPEHDNLWRLYAVWCARQVQHLMKDQRSIDALDVAERHARGLATDAELAAAWEDAEAAARDAARDAWAAVCMADAAWAAEAARAAAWVAAETAAAARGAWAAAWGAAEAAEAAWAAAWAAARAAQEQKLREILNKGEWL
jgi:hypothetical protein